MHLTIAPHKVSLIQQGHPWVFPKAILEAKPACNTGDLVQLLTTTGDWIGVGIYNAHSLYRVRVLATSKIGLPDPITLRSIIMQRLSSAAALRTRIQLPNAHTNAFRLFNSEADGLSGLTIDQFNNMAVIASSAYWVEEHRALILECLHSQFPHLTWIWRSQPKPLAQDGWQSVAEPAATEQTIVKEYDVQFKINFATAQKTGLFLDQRDNHQRIASYAQGARVLDLYTYTGGFALHAAKANAAFVRAIDSSAQAIERAQENALLNQVEQIEWIKGDAREYLHQAGDFDIVILDPPKLAPSMRNQTQAKNYYRFLHRELFKSMRSSTLLMTCNCSAALSAKQFVELVYLQAVSVNKTFRVLGVFGPAPCHPTLPIFPEGQYLTAVLGVVL
ncbi:MAG: class I SAM-dependent rRNA methyltransferase [Gammaproteobacteria bacterium]|nr:class I SAM-dependent rRNA methyltransferase [Gammaproteobacteria bacterium]